MRRWAKRLLLKFLARFGYEMAKARGHQFTIDGVEYRTDRCSTGRTPEGESAAHGAVRMIREEGRGGLAVLDICCGVGIIGLTMWARLREDPHAISRLAFADINIFNILSLQRAIRDNRIDHLMDGRISSYLSDGLHQIPRSQKFDLIVGNPPHYSELDDEVWVTSSRLSTVDAGWSFHRQFYHDAHHYLTEGGQIWLFENRVASRVEDSKPLIAANPNLTFLGAVPEPSAPRFFWVISQHTPAARPSLLSDR